MIKQAVQAKIIFQFPSIVTMCATKFRLEIDQGFSRHFGGWFS